MARKIGDIVGAWIPTGGDNVRLPQQLRQFYQVLTAARNLGTVLRAAMSQMAPGSDFSTLEATFALTAGTGQTVRDLVSSAANVLDDAAIEALLERLA